MLSPHEQAANKPLRRAAQMMMWLSIIYGVAAIGLGVSIVISLSGDQMGDGQRGMAIFFGIILLVVLAGMTVPMFLCGLYIRRGSREAIVWGIVLNAFVALLILLIDYRTFVNLAIALVFVSVAIALLHAMAVILLWNAWKSIGSGRPEETVSN
jgi:hypothetical protein